MDSSEVFETLKRDYPALEDAAHRTAFAQYIAKMWTSPSTYGEFLQAYLEFTTIKKPAYRKLASQNVASSSKSSGAKRSKKRSSRRRRSRRRRRKKK